MCVRKDEINEKKDGVAPFKKINMRKMDLKVMFTVQRNITPRHRYTSFT